MLRILFVSIALLLALPVFAQDAPPPPDEEAIEEATEEAAATPTELESRIQEVLSRIPELASVNVEAGEGIVTLTGEVPTAEKREAAKTIVSKLDDVLWVDNRIMVAERRAPEQDPSARDAAIREQLEGVFANVPALEDVDVSVRSGVVRLEGEVLTEAVKTKAEELAKSLDGVVYVDNALEEVREVQQRISPALQKARDVAEQFVATLPLFGVGIVILLIFFFLGRIATSVELPYRGLREKPLVLGIVQQVVRIIIFAAGILLVLELFELTALVGAVLGTAGVAGLAFGFAFKDIAENYLASIMLSLRQPFQKDDLVLIEQHEGKVVRLSTRETVLMTLEGNHLRIPNAVVFKSVIYNYTRNPLRRFDFVVGVGVQEDIAESLNIGLDAVNAGKWIIEKPPSFGIVERLGESAIELRFHAWFDQRESDILVTKSAAIRRVKEAFDAAGIDMPEPTTRVLQRHWEPEPKKSPARSAAAPEPEGPLSDHIDEQIAVERAETDETDLLR